jgi:hypothetical protein
MRAFIAAVAVVAVLAVASFAAADVVVSMYNTSDCTGASTTKTYATGACVTEDGNPFRAKYSCNSTAVSASIFASTDTSCGTAILSVSVPIGTCDKESATSSQKVTCSAGAIAFAAVAVVAAVLAMLI